jgi:hypothetical protein
MYDGLPREVQERFRIVDAWVRADDVDLDDIFDRQGWARFVDIDESHTAMGNYRENENVFYWVMIGPSESRPIIL